MGKVTTDSSVNDRSIISYFNFPVINRFRNVYCSLYSIVHCIYCNVSEETDQKLEV